MLIVEDNTGLENADSYVSVEECSEYFDKYGGGDAFYQAEDKVKERALRSATRFVDSLIRWVGQKFNPDQALQFPRENDEDFIPVPKEVIEATCEITEMVLNDELGASPIISERYGDTSVTYAQPHLETKLQIIKANLSGFGSSRATVVQTFRA